MKKRKLRSLWITFEHSNREIYIYEMSKSEREREKRIAKYEALKRERERV